MTSHIECCDVTYEHDNLLQLKICDFLSSARLGSTPKSGKLEFNILKPLVLASNTTNLLNSYLMNDNVMEGR